MGPETSDFSDNVPWENSMMCSRARFTAAIGVVGLLFGAACGTAKSEEKPDGKVIPPFNGRNLDGWTVQGEASANRWVVGHAKPGAKNPKELEVAPSTGDSGELINPKWHGVDLYSVAKFGDCTIDMELMVPKGSNSGIYPMGEYEVQVLDSYGRTTLNQGDMGAIYSVAPPRVNASKKPGQWQHIVIEFRAPRFSDGKKVANAKFVKVTLNGQVVQENAEVPGPTGGGITGQEAPTGPLKFQGNHGPVAFRNIKIIVPPAQ
jgi:hypothetical protein